MSRPLISCIVPVFNGARFLNEALDSIFAQTHRPLEVIVVDDGSTDDTPTLLAAYRGPLRTLHQANAGPPVARNRGLDVAAGQYIAFLDADDLWHPHKLARQLARFDARPSLDLCVTAGQNFWTPEARLSDPRARDPRHTEPWPGYGNTVALLARRRAFEVVGPFNCDLRVLDDHEWFIRAAERGLVKELLPEVLLYRRMHGANISDSLTLEETGQAHLNLLKAYLHRQRAQRR